MLITSFSHVSFSIDTIYLQEAMQLLGFKFGGSTPLNPAVARKETAADQKRYVVPEERAIGRPHMMGWLDLLGKDEELTGGDKEEGGDGKEVESFEADKWEEVKA
jgi:hypothetical protein